jgi:methylenetetrahydrofolate reductase (NADPH)
LGLGSDVSHFADLLGSGARPVITAELPAINSGGIAVVQQHVDAIAPHVDAINATDNPAAHAHASNVAIAIAIRQAGAEPIMQVVCRDKNRLALEADIVGAALFGVENICALTGDDVTAGDEPEARRVFDLDGLQLIQVAKGIADGHYLSGRAIDPAPPLFIGAVENPGAPPLHHRVDRALKKSEIGARFLQLQICYHQDRLETFVEGCVERRLTATTALLATICLTRSSRALTFMDERVAGISVPVDVIRRVKAASNEGEAAYQLALEQAQQALSLPGVSGIHIADFRHDGSLARLVADLGVRQELRPGQQKEEHAHGSQLAG